MSTPMECGDCLVLRYCQTKAQSEQYVSKEQPTQSDGTDIDTSMVDNNQAEPSFADIAREIKDQCSKGPDLRTSIGQRLGRVSCSSADPQVDSLKSAVREFYNQ